MTSLSGFHNLNLSFSSYFFLILLLLSSSPSLQVTWNLKVLFSSTLLFLLVYHMDNILERSLDWEPEDQHSLPGLYLISVVILWEGFWSSICSGMLSIVTEPIRVETRISLVWSSVQCLLHSLHHFCLLYKWAHVHENT